MIHDRAILEGLPELHGVQMLWFDDWYDGPLDGLADYGGREYWFAAVADPDARERHARRYVLHPLSSEQIVREWAEHRECAARTGIAGCMHQSACPAPPDGEADLEGWWRDHPNAPEWRYLEVRPIGWFSSST
jgi:hypothetical protein